jgi:glutaredoxin-like protein NrdH
MEHVDGTAVPGGVILYALSTCIWCKKTRLLLEELGVAYDYEYVDLLPSAAQDRIAAVVQKLTGRETYPTIIRGDSYVVGYRPDEIRALVGA